MAFVKYVGLRVEGTLADLFTSTETFVNAGNGQRAMA